MVETKYCARCGRAKFATPEFFHRRGEGLSATCKQCRNQARSDNRRAQIAADSDFDRKKDERRFWHVAGVYETMVGVQGERCYICGVGPIGAVRLSIDHCHETGVVRGLLCRKHNLALGQFGDNVDALLMAVAYLRSPPCAGLGHVSRMRRDASGYARSRKKSH